MVPGIKVKHSFEDDDFTKHKKKMEKLASEKKIAKLSGAEQIEDASDTTVTKYPEEVGSSPARAS